ncbi:hypothetical protein [Actinophytocola gossypii]|uniref:Excreted virulence factor EspC, type VII ESX diderm n=1 Tax=Actinophytocola gossypii TaxID=2812003 RepID=A0ABT2J2D2_9PSEU|nr:hypothetical protein [Actinophytocola gossypii]MCT2582005.1 hypothetical protein [Actinophytocola gossypii]
MTQFHMAPAEAGHAMNQLDAAGADLTTAWSSASSAIRAAAGQLGQGVLGQAFLQGYQRHADEVCAAADTCTRVPGQLAASGDASVAAYVTTDADNAALLT